MSQKRYPVNISALNLINICVEDKKEGEIQGVFYHYYDESPVAFFSITELIRKMEGLFDELVFPQASTRLRSFFDKEEEPQMKLNRPEKRIDPDELMEKSGRKGSFITCVKFRQKSTWQGEIFWKEEETRLSFSNTLEFIRKLDRAVSERETDECK